VRFILGGWDTEMIEIAQLLASTDYSVEYAKLGSARVNRSEAYEATYPTPKPYDVWIECKPTGYTKKELYSLGVDLIDHHQEGDFGYGMPAAKYWEASSLGQVCSKLGFPRTKRLNHIAAADHCLLSAYHEQCPDIKREDFISFRMSFFEGHVKDDEPPFEYLKSLHSRALKCPTISMGNATLYDLSSLMRTDQKWLSDMGCCFNMKTISIRQKKNRYKVFVSNLSNSEIQYFFDVYVPSLGSVLNTYGDPKRQFAGAVIEGEYVN
jgi:hypothetical protein